MSQELAVKPICSECGSEALGTALFCFSCGARLKMQEPEAEPESVADTAEEDKPIAAPTGDPFDVGTETGDQKEKSSAVEPEVADELADIGMRTASNLRKNPDVMRLRRIEVRWNSDEGSPNFWFILSTILLTLLALGIFLVSMYLR